MGKTIFKVLIFFKATHHLTSNST